MCGEDSFCNVRGDCVVMVGLFEEFFKRICCKEGDRGIVKVVVILDFGSVYVEVTFYLDCFQLIIQYSGIVGVGLFFFNIGFFDMVGIFCVFYLRG